MRLTKPLLAVGVFALGFACRPQPAPQTPTQSPPATTRSICYHTEESEWICPDTSLQIALADYESATLTIRTRGGQTVSVALPGNADAIFTSKAAVENFLLRYYDDVDTTKAAALRRRLESWK
jgi:hypothetical protein